MHMTLIGLLVMALLFSCSIYDCDAWSSWRVTSVTGSFLCPILHRRRFSSAVKFCSQTLPSSTETKSGCLDDAILWQMRWNENYEPVSSTTQHPSPLIREPHPIRGYDGGLSDRCTLLAQNRCLQRLPLQPALLSNVQCRDLEPGLSLWL